MGPLVTKAHFDKVKGYVDLGVDEGADLVVDGRDLVVDGHEEGYFLGPCLFDKVTAGMRIYEEEIFGPVLNFRPGVMCRTRRIRGTGHAAD
jgi:malonate-semialdehyde dehydrogenase (acetylating)/methylmalonate-semialdehyde dehydrogenase